MKGAGCRTCNGTGYKGRVALYEVMRFTDSLKEMVLQGASTAELKAAAIKQGMITLRASGIARSSQGVTTHRRDPARHDGRLTPLKFPRWTP